MFLAVDRKDQTLLSRPKLDEKSETIRIQMIATKAWATRLDQYAKKHLMNRSEAIRAIIDEALRVRRSEPAKSRGRIK